MEIFLILKRLGEQFDPFLNESIWEKFQKKLPSKSPALLGLNLMGFTDLFYQKISFHFL